MSKGRANDEAAKRHLGEADQNVGSFAILHKQEPANLKEADEAQDRRDRMAEQRARRAALRDGSGES